MRAVLSSIFVAGILLSEQSTAQTPEWLNTKPTINGKDSKIEIPIRMIGNKIAIEAEIGGTSRRFIFDTGSPSMISQKIADELGLNTLGQNTGVDAHGTKVTTNIVRTDIGLAGGTIKDVPVFAADLSGSKIANCLMDGVLGSEVLPLCHWQIDLNDNVLRCYSDFDALNTDNSYKIPLSDFGYPHYPYFGIKYSEKSSSTVMFDTGYGGLFAISSPDLNAVMNEGSAKKTGLGKGSIGSSLGGASPDQEHIKIQLKSPKIGEVNLPNMTAISRSQNPSLLGAEVLSKFVVTLSYEKKAAFFRPYKSGDIENREFGFKIDYDNQPTVSFIWNKSPADEAGLKIGQEIKSVNGSPITESCESALSLMTKLAEESEITLGGSFGTTILVKR